MENLPKLPDNWEWIDKNTFAWSCDQGDFVYIKKWFAKPIDDINCSQSIAIRNRDSVFIFGMKKIPAEELVAVCSAVLEANKNV
jgi:activator of HSP90 ATPase